MPDVLNELIDLLSLERIEENLFRGQSQDLGWGRVFGGQVVGQALSAADQTVPDDRRVHSMHAYFLRPGDVSRPIVFHVDPIRDGRSFTTRRVVAVQNGRAILNLAASFQSDEVGLDHQDEAPEVRSPDTLLSQRDLALKVIDRIPEAMRPMATADRPIEVRVVRGQNPFDPKVLPPRRQVWFRTRGKLPDDDALHRYLLAYTSDFSFLTTSMQPHGVDWLTPGFQVASIDHAMWFHRPFRMDEWLLHDIESPSASGSRGLVRGRFFDQQGRLVATTVQEGLIRDRR